MRKVLLVDDDISTLSGIKVILMRSDTQFKMITECNDGVEAEELLKKEKFDLVITDMKMPNMDGINFIRRAQNLEDKPKFLILSGYQDFVFAKEAMKYGVKEYLLKPVGRQDLIEAIKKIEEELIIEESYSLEREQSSLLRSIINIKEINLIFLDEMLTEDDISEILSRLNLHIFNHDYYIYAMEALKQDDSMAMNDTIIIRKYESLKHHFKNLGENVLIFLDMKGNIIFISPYLLDTTYIFNRMSILDDQKYIMGLGNRGTSPLMIRNVYLQAVEAIRYKVFNEGECYNRLIEYKDIEKRSKDHKLPIHDIKKLPEMLGTQKYNEVEMLLNKLFHTETLYEYTIEYSEKLVEYIYNYTYQYFISHMPIEFSMLEQNSRKLKKLCNFPTLEEYLNELREYFAKIDQFLNQTDLTDSDKVDEAIQFIKLNFDKNINLAYVSNHISLNYNYFSSMFRQKTGMRFVEYLNYLRVEKAKELLGDTELLINDIAKNVGCDNPKSFTRIFKSVVGVSPYDYRQKMRLYNKREG